MVSKRTLLEIDEYEHKASDVINFKLIRHVNDINSPDLVFHPTFTHQFFPTETISGFRDLCINMYFVASSLFCFLKYNYTKERTKLKSTDLSALTEGLPVGFTDDIEMFSKHIGEEFEPPGKKVYSYVVNGADYEIFLGDFRDPELQAYHQRLQYFLLFFIDRSSFIDDADPIWEILLVFEKVRDSVTGGLSLSPLLSFFVCCLLCVVYSSFLFLFLCVVLCVLCCVLWCGEKATSFTRHMPVLHRGLHHALQVSVLPRQMAAPRFSADHPSSLPALRPRCSPSAACAQDGGRTELRGGECGGPVARLPICEGLCRLNELSKGRCLSALVP